jgi:hypothetical protein
MRLFVLLVLLSSTAFAQAQWSRITLVDGRVVDGQITGGDQVNLFVQTQAGVFSIARTQVSYVTPMQAAPMPPPPESSGGLPRFNKGAVTFFGTYAITGIIALGRMEKDDDAKLGLIPLVGPVLWTRTDDDKYFSDGYDWLAVLSTGCQAIGIVQWLTSRQTVSPGVNIVTVGTKTFSGVSLSGQW